MSLKVIHFWIKNSDFCTTLTFLGCTKISESSSAVVLRRIFIKRFKETKTWAMFKNEAWNGSLYFPKHPATKFIPNTFAYGSHFPSLINPTLSLDVTLYCESLLLNHSFMSFHFLKLFNKWLNQSSVFVVGSLLILSCFHSSSFLAKKKGEKKRSK